MYECPCCGFRSLQWMTDYTYEDVGLPTSGVVKVFTCENCGAQVEAYMDYPEED